MRVFFLNLLSIDNQDDGDQHVDFNPVGHDNVFFAEGSCLPDGDYDDYDDDNGAGDDDDDGDAGDAGDDDDDGDLFNRPSNEGGASVSNRLAAAGAEGSLEER